MEFDDDDEFGDLYGDIITGGDQIPIQIPSTPPPSNLGGDQVRIQNPSSNQPDQDNKPELFPINSNIEEARVSEEDKIVIPGINSAPLANNVDFRFSEEKIRVSNSEDWDSDSEDDLNIVLNDDDDNLDVNNGEDYEDDLVIVGDENMEAVENQEMQQNAIDGESKENLDATQANGQKTGGNNQGFHGQHHSMFKYIRPGASAIGPQGQIRPPNNSINVGRGRGRGFNSGFGSVRAHSSSRGLDFTLPSYKTIFDVDIESFEEKPWRHPGVDISDYFNFGLDEDGWKEYFKQLDQFRIESTMQSKIRVYESGRAQQNYDPDLPPELAAAAGHHEITANNTNHGKTDNGQIYLRDQGRSLSSMEATFPTGRPIQVEIGSGERLPSIDTRQPRNRDPDVIIEIPLHDPTEDSTVNNSALEPSQNIEGDRHSESEYRDCLSQSNSNSKLRSPIKPAGSNGTHHSGRLRKGASHRRDSDTSNNSLSKRHDDNHNELQGNSVERSIEQKSSEHNNDMIALEDSIEVEEEETSDLQTSSKPIGDDDTIHSSKKQKLYTRDEQTSNRSIDVDDDIDVGLRETDNDNRRTNLTNDTQKQRESGDEVQGRGSKRVGSMNRREKHDFKIKDDYAREGWHEMDRKHMGYKGRDSMYYHPYPPRDLEPYSVPYPRRPRELMNSFIPRREDESRNRSKLRASDVNRDGLKFKERDDVFMRREKDNEHSRRERIEKDDISVRSREREREDRQRLKRAHEDREKIVKHKNDSKTLVSDNNHHRERRHEKNYSNEERDSRHERSSARNDRSSPCDNQHVSKERHRESSRKNKDADVSVQNNLVLGKRKHEDHRVHHNEKVSLKGLSEQEDLTSNDKESLHESRKGRSKLERWTSHREKDVEDTIINESKTENNDVIDSDRHLDTVEKLKRRSERFKLPMPIPTEKDATLKAISENNDDKTLNETEPLAVDNEVKTERPARKRRWTSQ